jgi:hypothetical protein
MGTYKKSFLIFFYAHWKLSKNSCNLSKLFRFTEPDVPPENPSLSKLPMSFQKALRYVTKAYIKLEQITPFFHPSTFSIINDFFTLAKSMSVGFS